LFSPEALSSPASPLPQEKKPIVKKKLLRPKPGPDHPWRKDFKKKFTYKKESPTDIFTGQQHKKIFVLRICCPNARGIA
jgi:hypothetical protein